MKDKSDAPRETPAGDNGARSRRAILSGAIGVAAVAGIAAQVKKAEARVSAGDCVPAGPPIANQKMFEDSLAAPARRVAFGAGPVTGAQVFANLCADEKLSALFMAPGNYQLTHEIAQVGIPSYGGRSEGSMCCAADGYIRASGEIAAASGTEGPGFAHMVMGIASAHFANTPLLVLASNKSLAAEDTQRGIQWMLQQKQTEGLRKYGKRITTPERIYEYGTYAFRNLKGGVPDVVHLDFPDEVVNAQHADASKLTDFASSTRYRAESRAAPEQTDLRNAIDMIAKASRPVIVAGHGVILRKAWEPLLRAAERNDIPVVGSGPIRGVIPDDHRLSALKANSVFKSADLVVFIGQYLMPTPGEYTFAPSVPTIRVHPVQEELGRNWPVDLGIVSDEKLFLEALADGLPRGKRDSWVAEIAGAARKTDEMLTKVYSAGLGYSQQASALHPAVLCQELHNFLYREKIDPKQSVTLSDGAVIGAYAGYWLRAQRPAQQIVSMYQFGAMGVAFPQAIGAAAAVQRGVGLQAGHSGAPVFVVSGDGCIGYGLMEIETAVKYKLPVICLVYNNNCWGTFMLAGKTPRALQLHMFQENLRYDKVAEGMGARGAYVQTPEELRVALKAAYDAAVRDKASTVINCQGARDFHIPSQYPVGVPLFAAEPGLAAGVH